MTNNRMIILSIALLAVMFLTLNLTVAHNFIAMGERISEIKCISNFWSKTCCWTEQGPSSISRVCVTCLDNGDGTYRDCREHPGRGPNLPNKPDDPYAPTPDRPFGGIFKIPTPEPAVQDTPQSETSGPQQGGIFQEDPLVGGGTAAQDTPQSETSGPQQGGILGNWGLLKTNQDNEKTSEDGVTEDPPATEETQPVLVQEEPIPSCSEGQILDEETNLCVLEETEVDEQQEEQEQPQQEEAEEEQSSEKEDEN